MTRAIVDVGGDAVTVAVDDRRPAGAYLWGVARAELLDEISEERPRAAVRVTSDTRWLDARAGSTGLVGPIGTPTIAFSRLATNPYPIRFTVEVDGYVAHDVERTVAIPGAPFFPDRFDPVPPLVLGLHRRPTVIGGSVRLHPTLIPVAGATVSITGIWRTHALATVKPPVPPLPPNIVSLSPPLYAPRTAALDQLRRQGVLPAAPGKRLVAPAPAGSRVLRLSDSQATIVGTLLQLDTDPDRIEHVGVAAIVPGASPDDPATATLAHPLFWTHAVGAAVVPVALQPPGPVNPLAVAAIRGDACALLTGTAGLASGDVVEISGGSAPEYHHVRLFSTLSGPDGSFALPPLSRVAQARLRIADGVHPAVTLHHMPSYGRAEEHVDVILH